jgi:vacuolar-type H+-ATPase subunit E/Vma4
MTRFNSKRAGVARARLPQLAAAAALVLAVVAASAQQQGQQTVDQAAQAVERANATAAEAQEGIDAAFDQLLDEADRYAQALLDAESLEKYNMTLGEQVAQQRAQIRSLEEQLTEIETTNRAVSPLMAQMVSAIEQFVALDVPFLIEERRTRVAALKATLERADVPISEKYRNILEAYQIELEYGRTLDDYDGTLGEGADERTVVFVRLGRVSLMYQTLDGSETGYWDANSRSWKVDNSYAAAVEQALRVARREGAPELLTVPVPAPEEARS